MKVTRVISMAACTMRIALTPIAQIGMQQLKETKVKANWKASAHGMV